MLIGFFEYVPQRYIINIKMPFFGILGSNKFRLYAVISVGSHMVEGVVFECKKDSTPRVRKKIVYKIPHSLKDPVKLVGKLREFIFTMVKSLERVPSSIIVGLGPNIGVRSVDLWSGEDAAHDPMSRQKSIASGMLVYPLELYSRGYSLARFFSSGSSPLNIKSVLGRSASWKNVDFRVMLLSFNDPIGSMLENMKKSLGGLPIKFLPQEVTLRGGMARALKFSDALLIMVGGEETQVLLFRNGELAHFTSFSLGIRHFMRGMAKFTSLSMEEAESDFFEYIVDRMPQSKESHLRNFFDVEFGGWKKMFIESLDEFYAVGPLPANVFLSGEGASLKGIANIIRSSDWIRNFSYNNSVVLNVLDASAIFSGNTLQGFLRGPEEFVLASLIFHTINPDPLLNYNYGK